MAWAPPLSPSCDYSEDKLVTGQDKSFSNVVARWATIGPYLVARPKKWLPRIC